MLGGLTMTQVLTVEFHHRILGGKAFVDTLHVPQEPIEEEFPEPIC